MHYRPLPANLTIKESSINGLGLFANMDIVEGEVLGITHVKDDRFPNGLIRTPLGGFFNHSEDPNIKIEETGGDLLIIIAIRDINKAEEITAKYNMYDPSTTD
jgi:SET domain-containing protein